MTRCYRMGDDQMAAVSGISFAVEPGEMVAVVGTSGSGKTTLLNLLGCLDTCTGGAYTLGGRDVAALSDAERSALRNIEIGFVFQSFQLLPRADALHNVALPLVYRGVPPPERQARARAALEHVGLGHRMTHRPNQLSGGQRQRVAIARAIVGQPSVLLADEPTGNLDSATGRAILAIFRALHEDGHTIVIVTHSPAIAAACPRAIQLHDGRLVADGPGADVAARMAAIQSDDS